MSRERQIVAFSLGGESYGVANGTVREIITMRKVTPVPQTPSFVEGVINLRGHVVPVIDPKKRLGLPPGAGGRGARIMVVETNSATVGCIVDTVDEVLTTSRRLRRHVFNSEYRSLRGTTQGSDVPGGWRVFGLKSLELCCTCAQTTRYCIRR
ncbi:MAG: chemotaxis protein CheW [Bacillota bacterium]